MSANTERSVEPGCGFAVLLIGLTLMLGAAIYDASVRIAAAIHGKPDATTEAVR